jgi:hypothetical protein
MLAPQSGACPVVSGNTIPTGCISSLAQQMLQYVPLPNQPGLTRNYRLIASNPSNTQNLNARVNTNVTQKDTLAVGFNLQERNSQSFEPYGCCNSTDGQGINTNISWRHRFGNRSFNARAGLQSQYHDGRAVFHRQCFFPDRDCRSFGRSAQFRPPNLGFANFSGLSDSNWSKTAT